MCTNWWTCLRFICLLACVPSTRYLVSRGVSVLVLTVRQRPFLGLFVACRCLALTKHQHRLPPKSHNWPRSRNITARSIIVSHSLLILNSPLMYRHVYLCLCVRVPCIHRQKGCGREGILIWRNVSRASLWDDLRETEGRSGRVEWEWMRRCSEEEAMLWSMCQSVTHPASCSQVWDTSCWSCSSRGNAVVWAGGKGRGRRPLWATALWLTSRLPLVKLQCRC